MNAGLGMGIYRVQLAGLDTVTGGADGYGNYACRSGAVLQRGTTYTLSVRTNPNADENVRAWIDYDNNGQFDAGELVLTSAVARQHQGTFTVPAAAVMGPWVRLRIAADYANAPVPTPCSTPQYSQTEDYRILIGAAASLPHAAFTTPDSVTCTGTVRFQDRSRNAPTAWRWEFGDGATSAVANPVHAYATAGTYAVSLRVCNAIGCDSLTRPALVVVRNDGPRPAPCQPPTSAYCCNFGLARVRLGALDHRPGGGTASYQDVSCAFRATLRAGWADTLRITTGGLAAHDVRVYLDANDDGQFGPAELLYQGVSVINPSAVVVVNATQAGLVYNRALRLRVWADYAGSPATGACASPVQGQVADYSVLVLPNAVPPSAAFAVAYAQPCGPVRVAVTNTSRGATGYAWDFGDGTAAVGAAPPVHAYATAGAYTIRLVASNAAGRDTARQEIAVASACPIYCTAPGWGGNADTPLYLSRVQVADLDNQDVRAPGVGYRDYTARVATVRQGQTVQLRAYTLPWRFAGNGPWDATAVWADFDQDGVFATAELLAQGSGFSPHVLMLRIPHNARVGAVRLRVMVYEPQLQLARNGCMAPLFNGAFEDYTLLVLPAQAPPQTGFTANLTATCSGMVQFTDTTGGAPRAWLWNFGDGATSTLANPQHAYAAAGTYTVSLQASNGYGTTTASRPNYLTVSALGQGPRPTAVQFPRWQPCCGYGLAGFQLSTLAAYVGGVNQVGYRDESCQLPALYLAAGSSYPVTVQVLPGNPAHNAYLWLDANDDGYFAAGEVLFASGNPSIFLTKQGTITVPTTALGNRPLRLRLLLHGLRNYDYRVQLPVPDAQIRDEDYDQIRDFTVWVSGGVLATTQPPGVGAWSIYPSPTGGLITIAGVDRPVRVKVFNLLGQVVISTQLHPASAGKAALDLTSLRSGSYFVQLESSVLRQRVTRE
jgi:PKD repeat protein